VRFVRSFNGVRNGSVENKNKYELSFLRFRLGLVFVCILSLIKIIDNCSFNKGSSWIDRNVESQKKRKIYHRQREREREREIVLQLDCNHGWSYVIVL
jgi:hypothetical protein